MFDLIVQGFFLITAAFIIFAILMILSVPKTMQAAYWLILMLAGVSVLFLLSNSEIIFAFQISIYAGGISVLLLFAALLTQHDDYLFGQSGGLRGLWTQFIAFLLIAINLIFVSWTAITSDEFSTSNSDLGSSGVGVNDAFENTYNFTQILWDQYAIVVPLLATLLLAALLGSIKLVIREWELEELSEVMQSRYRFDSEVTA